MLLKKFTKFRRSAGKGGGRSKVENFNNTDHGDDKVVDHTDQTSNNKKNHNTNGRFNHATTTGPVSNIRSSGNGGRGFGDHGNQKTTNTTGAVEQHPQQDQQHQNVHLHGRMAELQADMERHEFEMMRLKKRMVSIVNKVQVNDSTSTSNANSKGNANGIVTANISNGIINTNSLPNRYSSSAATIPGVPSSGLAASRTTSPPVAAAAYVVPVATPSGKTALLAGAETSSPSSSVPTWMKQLKQKQQQKRQHQNGTTTRSGGNGGGGGGNGSWVKPQSEPTVSKTKTSTPATTTTMKLSTTMTAGYDGIPFGRMTSNKNNKKNRGETVVTSNNHSPERKPTTMTTATDHPTVSKWNMRRGGNGGGVKNGTVTPPTAGQSKSTTTPSWKKPAPAVGAATSSSSSSWSPPAMSSPPSTAGLLAEIRKGTKLNKVSSSVQTAQRLCKNKAKINKAPTNSSRRGGESTQQPNRSTSNPKNDLLASIRAVNLKKTKC